MSMDIDQLKEASVRAALKKMQDGGTFYCTTVDKCAETLGVYMPKEAKQVFHNYHCVDFGDMSKQELHSLLQLMAEVFNQEPIDIPEIIFGQRKSVLNLGLDEPKEKKSKWKLLR